MIFTCSNGHQVVLADGSDLPYAQRAESLTKVCDVCRCKVRVDVKRYGEPHPAASDAKPLGYVRCYFYLRSGNVITFETDAATWMDFLEDVVLPRLEAGSGQIRLFGMIGRERRFMGMFNAEQLSGMRVFTQAEIEEAEQKQKLGM